MRYSLKILFWISILLLFLCAACTESQLVVADKIVSDVNDVAVTISEVLESPIVRMVPHPYLVIISVVVGGLLGGVKVWDRIRKTKLGTGATPP